MRALAWLVLAGCGGSALPAPMTRAASAWAVATRGDDLYWIESDSSGLRLRHRGADDLAGTLDEQPAGFPGDQGRLEIVLGGDAIVWGYTGGFTGCGRLRAVSTIATDVELQGDSDELCQIRAIAEADGVLIAMTYDGLAWLDVASGKIVASSSNEEALVDTIAETDAVAYASVIFENDAVLARFDARERFALFPLVDHIGGVVGPVVTDRGIAWAETSTSPPRVYEVPLPPAHAIVTEIAELDESDLRITGAAWAGGALWLAEQDPSMLVRIDRDGSTQRFEVPYIPSELAATSDRLWITTFVEDMQGSEFFPLIEQPL